MSYLILFSLLETYEDQTTEKAKESMLSDIKFGKTQRYFCQNATIAEVYMNMISILLMLCFRKIGPSVSKTVYQLYCTKGALS